MSRLAVLMDGRLMGWVAQDKGNLSFTYDDRWRMAEGAYPLSTAMPLVAEQYGDRQVSNFLWGLLPDNDLVLQRWARRFGVSPRNPFALIAHVGEDCAGAAQFIPEDRLEAFLQETGDNAVEWLTETNIGERLRVLANDASAGRTARDTGQFSLAGAQPKTALHYSDGRWGIPHGRVPTTHILKPPTGEFDGFAENEHLCLRLAASLGLPTARSEIKVFGDQTAIVVERYDRQRTSDAVRDQLRAAETIEAKARTSIEASDPANADLLHRRAARLRTSAQMLYKTATVSVLRVHQEDMCQALNVHPANKYQNFGGPGPQQIIRHLRNLNSASETGEADVSRFVDALIFNWLIGGTDAHAKNYSILIGNGGRTRLAPLYDMASILAYDDHDPRKIALAMKIGDQYRLSKIKGAEWFKFAAENRLEGEQVIGRIRNLAMRLPDLLSREISRMEQDGIAHPAICTLQAALTDRAKLAMKF